MNMGTTTRRRVVVNGTVQGVGFRMSAENEATRLGLSGYVRNTGDGAVETEIEGDAAAVAIMVEWLKTGPRHARVNDAVVDELEPIGGDGFDITG